MRSKEFEIALSTFEKIRASFPELDGWETVTSCWDRLSIPWPQKSFKVVQNLPLSCISEVNLST